MNQKDFNDKLAAEAKKRRKSLLREYEDGKNGTELAAKYGISKQRVSQLLRLARAE